MIGPDNVGPQGVSGMGSPIPDQGAIWPNGPISQSCDEKKQNAQKLRIYLPDRQYHLFKDKAPKDRTRAIAAILGSIEANIDLGKLIDAAAELRRLGVLLNQALRLAHQDRVALDFIGRVEAVVKAIEELKP